MASEGAPIIKGQLHAFPISDVLQFLGASRVTGTLSVTFRDRRAFVLLQDGWIVGASSAKSPNRVKKEEIARDRQAAEEELLARVCEVITRAMAWPKGHFAFSNDLIGPVSPEENRPRLQPERVLMETALAIDQERRVG